MLDHTASHRITRRRFLTHTSAGLGGVAVASLLDPKLFAGPAEGVKPPHFAPKARRVIYLFMSGGPSHIDLFDHKPLLREHHGTELPASVRMGQRVTGMTAGQK